MKIGFNMLLWTPFVQPEHFPIFEKLKETGYDGVELELIEGTPDDYAKAGAELDRLGLKRTTVTIVLDEPRNPSSSNPEHRKAALEHFKWAVDCNAALGSEVMCGPYFQPLGVFSGEPPTDDEKKYVAEVHHEAAEYAQKSNIVLAIEALNRFECYLINTMDDLAAHVKRVDHPNLGLMYDTFHGHIEERDPIGMIEKYLPLMRHFHVSENDRGTPGRGQVDFDAQFRALRKGGYDEWITIESFGRSLPDLAATTCVWRDLSSSPEEVYQEGFKVIKEGWEKANA
jgi:D-psicose/D-tagatose/L-ribulose 3-epimerase